jgi:hypothetical protein
MGASTSTEQTAELAKSLDIDSQLVNSVLTNDGEVLIYGLTSSGKSTIMKQIEERYKCIAVSKPAVDVSTEKIMHTDDVSEDVKLVHRSVIEGMICLITICKERGIMIVNAEVADEFLETVLLDSTLRSRETALIKQLWSDFERGIKKAYALRFQYPMNPNCKYFLDDIDRISSDEYVPTMEDRLRVYSRKYRLCEVRGEALTPSSGAQSPVSWVDFGQKDISPLKIMRLFGVMIKCIIFVVDVSTFDVWEDGIVKRNGKGAIETETETETVVRENKLLRAVSDFELLITSKEVRDTPVFLFMNKVDIFREKVKVIDLKDVVDGIGGGSAARSISPFLDYKHGLCTCGGGGEGSTKFVITVDAAGVVSGCNCTCGVVNKSLQYIKSLFDAVRQRAEAQAAKTSHLSWSNREIKLKPLTCITSAMYTDSVHNALDCVVRYVEGASLVVGSPQQNRSSPAAVESTGVTIRFNRT